MFYPSLSEVKQMLAKQTWSRIPIRYTLLCDTLTPVTALQKIKNKSQTCFLFESAQGGENWGRYSLLGLEPSLQLTCSNKRLRIKGNEELEVETEDPLYYIRKLLQENQAPPIEGMPPFTGGFVGYFSYDFIRYSKIISLPDNFYKKENQEIKLMLFEKVIVFDQFKHQIILIFNMETKDVETNYSIATKELKELADLLLKDPTDQDKKSISLKLKTPLQSRFTKQEYVQMVQQAKQRIKQGEVYQVVLSNSWSASCKGNLLDTYRVLRNINPSPYMFYLCNGTEEIAGASPETLIKLRDRKVSTFPLAGTRSRGSNQTEQSKIEQELLSDEKECAEHDMLVDLSRNDLGKICEPNSIRVTRHRKIESFSHVVHMASCVEGDLYKNCDVLDALKAVLPAGTLSGAPKNQACAIIYDMEKTPRGVYGGAVGYIDFAGNMDMCIAIRMAVLQNNTLSVRAGAGIVLDSNPEKEYQECKNKAQAIIHAIEQAQGGILNDTFNR